MLGVAVDFLWKRTGVGGSDVYKSHSAACDFLDRHPKLVEAVLHIFQENRERQISNLKLSPGMCSTALYLMASCDTDGEAYRKTTPPSQEVMDLTHWDKAKKFWVALAKGKDAPALVKSVGLALGSIVDEEGGARVTEKMIVVAKGWKNFLEDKVEKDSAVLLPHYESIENVMTLTDETCFGGIDVGHQDSGDDETQNPGEQVQEKTKEQLRKERVAKTTAKLLEMRATPAAPAGSVPVVQANPMVELEQLHAEQMKALPGVTTVIVLKSRSGHVNALGSDAEWCAKALNKTEVDVLVDGTKKLSIVPQGLADLAAKLVTMGVRVVVAEKVVAGPAGQTKTRIEVLGQPTKAAPKPAAKPVAKPAAVPAKKPANGKKL